MSTQRASKCCVCGQATDKRCGPCGKHGIDLFFCSPEHQKLVWKNHKQICGPNAHPLRFPLLSEEEANELLKLEDSPFPYHHSQYADALNSIPAETAAFTHRGLSRGTLGKVVEFCCRNVGSTYKEIVQTLRAPNTLPLQLEQQALAVLRSYLKPAKERAYGAPVPFARIPLWTLVSCLDHIVDPVDIQADWIRSNTVAWSQCEHQALVLYSLLKQRPTDVTITPSMTRQALDQLFDLLGAAGLFPNEDAASDVVRRLVMHMWDVVDFVPVISCEASGVVVRCAA